MGNSLKGEYMPKRRNIRKILGMGVLCLFLLGCSKDSFLLPEEGQENLAVEEEQDTLASEVSQENHVAGEQQDGSAVDEEVSPETSDTVDDAGEHLLGVHICGAVHQPGVYFLEQGQRICHAIEVAGGLKDEADGDYINQALLLEDGMKITVPTKEEVAQMEMAEAEVEKDTRGTMSYVQTSKDYETQSSKDSGTSDKVDLNTADEALLCTLPGIGASRAKSIISFRTKNGPFEKIEDVMKVSGIKEAAFEKIKDLIKVSN